MNSLLTNVYQLQCSGGKGPLTTVNSTGRARPISLTCVYPSAALFTWASSCPPSFSLPLLPIMSSPQPPSALLSCLLCFPIVCFLSFPHTRSAFPPTSFLLFRHLVWTWVIFMRIWYLWRIITSEGKIGDICLIRKSGFWKRNVIAMQE